MVDVSQVTGDAPSASAVKRRNQKSATADIVKGLVRVLLMSSLKDDVHIAAQLRELDRRLHGNP